MSTVISVENVSKVFRLGQIGGGTLKEDFARWCAKLRGKPDPLFKIGQEHHARHVDEKFWALDDVSFVVNQGEVLGVIGRNGAGKSTLLKILSQVTTPTSGQVRIKGRIASLLEVGTGFHPELTGRDNIFLNGAILGMTKSEIRKKLDEIVAFSEVEEFIDTPVKRYSSGMYVRLAFAVAAHLEPDILIVDEVLAVGDAQFQRKCLGKVDEVAKGGRTVLLVSHNLAMIKKLCTIGALLEQGRLTQFGSSEEVAGAYQKSADEDFPIRSRFDPSLSSKDLNVQLKSVEVFGQQENSPPTAGTTLNVRLHALFRSALLNPSFIVRIRSDEEQPVVYLSTSPISGISTGRCNGLVTCTLRLDQIPLTEGTYEIGVGIGLPNICYLIPVTSVGRFWIEGSDCYHSGTILNNRECIIAPKHEWIIKHCG